MMQGNPANYRLRILLDIFQALVLPSLILYITLPQFLPNCTLGWWSLLAYPCFWAFWATCRNSYYTYSQLQDAKTLGARPIPRVRGKWPGNVDILLKMMKDFKTSYILDPYLRLFEEYQSTTLNLRILWMDTIISMDQEHAKFVMATGFQHFWRGRAQKERFETFLGEGIFNRDDEKWKLHRSIARPFFARERISDFDVFEKYTSRTLNILSSTARMGEACEAQDLYSRFSLDAASEFLFGQNLDTLSASRPIPGKTALGPKGSATDDSWGAFTLAFESAQQNITTRARIGRLWPLLELFGDKNVPHAKVIREWVDPLVQQAMLDYANHKAAGVTSPLSDKNFLQHLVESTEDPVLIRDQLLSMLLASRDTTATVLTYVTYFMALYPDVTKRLRDEVISAVGTQTAPTYEQLRSMKYLRAVLNETLRLFPPVPLNVRESRSAGFTLPRSDPTYPSHDQRPLYMPPNTTIVYLPLLTQRNSALWGPDADVFDPERWLKPERIAQLVANPTMYTPFSAGPRICIGQNYAYNEMSYFLVRLLQRFESFELAPEFQPQGSLPPHEWEGGRGRQAFEKIWPGAAVTLYVKGGLWVRFRKAKS
ncbi:hypothetical protein AX16_007455 [Volvariella volvacea WC 439]|nr:hypothetical protein AX16_007455 [Volvariella volvacea WC 439]